MVTEKRADIIAFSRDEKPVVLVEVKVKPALNSREVRLRETQLTESLGLMPTTIPYAMLADSKEIRVYHWNGQRLSGPAAILATAQALIPYEPDYGQKPIYHYYLIGLVEAWLRDLAYHWKLPLPPYAAEMAEIGLAEQLAGGSTRSEAALAA